MMTTLPPSPLRLSTLLISCLLLASILITGCGREEAAPAEEVARPVKVITLGSPETGVARTFPGKVRAAERADLAFQVSGKLIELQAKEGDEVQEGDVLCVLEAMKMENELRAGKSGVVKEIAVAPGSDVEMGEVLVVVE